jgi:hypothetical protein
MIRVPDEFLGVKQLCQSGLSDYATAALTGVPRATVQRWRRRMLPPGLGREPAGDDWRIVDERAYCYLLGVYGWPTDGSPSMHMFDTSSATNRRTSAISSSSIAG